MACNYLDLACVPKNDQYNPGECKRGSLDLRFSTPVLNVLKTEDNDSEHTCVVEVKTLHSVINNLDSGGNTPQSHNCQINVSMSGTHFECKGSEYVFGPCESNDCFPQGYLF